MGLINIIRAAAQRAAQAIQQAGRAVVDKARRAVLQKVGEEAEKKTDIYKEETPTDYAEASGISAQDAAESFEEAMGAETEAEKESLAEKLKEADLEARAKAQQQAYEKFNELYFDNELTRQQYDDMWNTIGEFSNDNEEYGSPSLIILYEEMYEKYGAGVNDPQLFRDLFEQASKSINAMYPSDAIDIVYDMIQRQPTLEDLYDSLQSVYD